MFSSQNSQVSNAANYIEDVFSTYLYTGNGSTQTITNGIDLSTKGGLVWLKSRSQVASHGWFDTLRGANNQLISDSTAAAQAVSSRLDAFTSSGFTLGTYGSLNGSGSTYASWTFRKQPKFFDVVTYTGNGANRAIAHNLGSVPGFIVVKSTSAVDIWECYHRSLGPTKYIRLDSTNAEAAASAAHWQSTTPTATEFFVGTTGALNTNGVTYVGYLFAHDAGGFGLTGTDNVISCGSYSGNGSATGPVVTLGYEPQFVLIKKTSGSGGGGWHVFDVMRGWSVANNTADLNPNTSSAESSSYVYAAPNATGFQILNTWTDLNQSGSTYIYIAIRRGPMKVPTSGTSVFKPVTRTGTGTSAYSVTGVGFSPDSIFIRSRNNASGRNWNNFDRLRGIQNDLVFGLTNAETNNSDKVSSYDMGGYSVPATPSATLNASGENFIDYLWKRAPSFMDVVCYNRTSGATVTHNLGVTPELLIVKRRGGVEPWGVMRPNTTGYLLLNAADALSTGLSATATSTTFTLGTGAFDYSDNYVAYLFATLAGVSKVGSYTGNGSSQTINCGFTGGARFVLIKRTDTTGDWYVWDTARGIVAGNDPYLGLNTYVNEVTTNDTIDPDSTGFIVNQVAATNVNVTSATYIFLAIA